MPHRDRLRQDTRRFLVRSPRLALYSGVYEEGEIITDTQAGSARERLVAMGHLAETDYDLSASG